MLCSVINLQIPSTLGHFRVGHVLSGTLCSLMNLLISFTSVVVMSPYEFIYSFDYFVFNIFHFHFYLNYLSCFVLFYCFPHLLS